MKKKVKLIALLFAFLSIFCLALPVSASSANTKAHKALNRQLKADKYRYYYDRSSKMRYAYADINGDHIDD